MEEPGIVCVLSVLMFLISFFSGTIPLRISLHEKQSLLLLCFSTGLLIGGSLVLLPESMNLIPRHPVDDESRKRMMLTMMMMMERKGRGMMTATIKEEGEPEEGEEEEDESFWNRSFMEEEYGGGATTFKDDLTTMMEGKEEVSREKGTRKFYNDCLSIVRLSEFKMIGFILICGFIMMMVLEHVLWQTRVPGHVAVSDLASHLHETKKLLLTVGLVVHSMTNGIGLGVISASLADTRRRLESSLFLGMTLHKIPSAFGLSTILLHEKFASRLIRRHLMSFSLATPLAWFITFMIVRQVNQRIYELLDSYRRWLILFSTGMFLYVALVETLPGIYRYGLGLSEIRRRLTGKQLALLILGIFIPFLLMSEHKV